VMFIGDFEKAASWIPKSVVGCKRFLDRVCAMADIAVEIGSASVEAALHRTIRKVTGDIEEMKFNTAIAAMMSFVNVVYDAGSISRSQYRRLLLILNPFAPHVTEELWENLGFGGRLYQAAWPAYDEALCREDTVEIAVQLNGKLRGHVAIPADASDADAVAAAKADANVTQALRGMQVVKEIYVRGKLVNIVAKPA